MTQPWQWLAQTYWYVPERFLAAPQLDPAGGPPVWMVDQTVWQIEDCRHGYFWGNTAILLYGQGDDPSTQRVMGRRLAGSLTPEGSVQMSFMPETRRGASQATVGTGRFRRDAAGLWAFEMQMGTGATDLVVHWADMLQCRPGDAAWDRLPGTPYSVPELLAAAGFASGA